MCFQPLNFFKKRSKWPLFPPPTLSQVLSNVHSWPIAFSLFPLQAYCLFKFGHLFHNLLLFFIILCDCCSMSTTFLCSFILPNIPQLGLMVVALVLVYDGTWKIGFYASNPWICLCRCCSMCLWFHRRNIISFHGLICFIKVYLTSILLFFPLFKEKVYHDFIPHSYSLFWHMWFDIFSWTLCYLLLSVPNQS